MTNPRPRLRRRPLESDPSARVRALIAEVDDLRALNDALLLRVNREARRPRFAASMERALKAEADARRTTVSGLIRATVEVAIRDRMFVAILDE